MTIAAGSRFGPYEILSALGAGGMGEIYRARDTRLDRDVAVKVVPSALAGDSKKFGTQGTDLDFALLVDGQAAEREQGITIDVAYRFF